MSNHPPLSSYRTLGRSGLAVSPLALGTMTFGTARWGSDEDVSRAVFNAYVEAGGNFVDTADVYASGRSEEMLGDFMAERSLRNSMVLATKFGFASGQGPHAGGNGAKHVYAALEGSLKRLRTDFIDLYWIHVWDSSETSCASCRPKPSASGTRLGCRSPKCHVNLDGRESRGASDGQYFSARSCIACRTQGKA